MDRRFLSHHFMNLWNDIFVRRRSKMSGFEQNKQVNILVERYPQLDVVKDTVIAAYNIMEASYEKVGNFW